MSDYDELLAHAQSLRGSAGEPHIEHVLTRMEQVCGLLELRLAERLEHKDVSGELASTLAQHVANGEIRLDDERITEGRRQADQLRAGRFEVERLRRLIDSVPTPLIVPKHRERPVAGVIDRQSAYALRHAWAIPSEHALRIVAALRPLVAVETRTGYWPALLRERGADVLAFDRAPNPLRNLEIGWRWGSVRKGPPAVCRRFPDRTLLLVSPSKDSGFALDALASYRGARMVFAGAQRDGTWTAGERLTHVIKRAWSMERVFHLPSWPDTRVVMAVFRRR